MTAIDAATRSPRRGPPRATFGWSRQRRVQAARIVRLLLPEVTATGGFVSSELSVALPGGATGRPDVAVARTDPPADGVLARPPDLVVAIDREGADERRAGPWLALGTPVVWHLVGAVVLERRPGGARLRSPGEILRVAGLPGMAVAVDELLGATGMQR